MQSSTWAPPSLRLHEDAGWIEGAADSLGGRPRQAASAGVSGPAPVWGFSLSTETIYCRWPTWIVKVFAPLKTTR